MLELFPHTQEASSGKCFFSELDIPYHRQLSRTWSCSRSRKVLFKKLQVPWRETWMPAVLEFGRKSSIQTLLEKYKSDETGIYL